MKPKYFVRALIAAIIISAFSLAASAQMTVDAQLDIAKTLKYFGQGIAWLKGQHDAETQKKIDHARTDLQISLAQLASENRHLVEILKAMRLLRTFPDDHAVLEDLEYTITKMHDSLDRFNNALELIDPTVAASPDALRALFDFQNAKRVMLAKLKVFTDPAAGALNSHQVDVKMLDTYIRGLTRIANEADQTYKALAAVPAPESH